jgi:integrase
VRLEKGEWLRKEPKTAASVRSITLSPFTVERLEGHLEQYGGAGSDALVFTNAKGNPLVSSRRMGHSSITVTLDRYGHLFPELDEATAVSFGVELTAEHERRAKKVVHASFGHEA